MSDDDAGDDPFDALDEAADAGEDEDAEADAPGEEGAADPDDAPEDREETGADGQSAESDDPFDALGELDGEDNPFADIAADADVDAGGADNLFEDIGVEDPLEAPSGPQPDEPEGPVVEPVELGTDTVVVPASTYCRGCEYFDEPPEVRCTHSGTQIVELVDLNRFKVRNCPIVAQRVRAGLAEEGEVVPADEEE